MKESRHEKTYYIKQVAAITGLSKQVIRKWEERYDVIEPLRLANGYRVYSDEDINTLLQLETLQKQGFSTGQAANMLKSRTKEADTGEGNLDDFVIQLLEKGYHCDEKGMDRILQQAFHHYGLERFLDRVVLPFFKEVGNKWEAGVWQPYQESVASMAVRDFLIQIRRGYYAESDAPLAVAACLPGEAHEIPVHVLALKALLKGWRIYMVGASPAPRSIESLVENMQPKLVMLSASTTEPFEQQPLLVDELDVFAGKHGETSFYIGGAGTVAISAGWDLEYIKVTNDVELLLDLMKK